MMTNSPNRDQLTVDDLRAYQAGLLTGAARHRVERLLLEQPLYADALAGLEALQQTGASLPAQTAQLRSALRRRVHESATKRRLWPLWLTTAIAAIVLVLCIAIYLIFFTKPVKAVRPGPKQTPIERSSSKLLIDVESCTSGCLYNSLAGDIYYPEHTANPMLLHGYTASDIGSIQAL